MHKHTNRLKDEKSPYLKQHSHNPVDWYPWGKLAFKKSKDLDRPIFLSIGYSTCHWCHVMEDESFEDEDIAKLMNKAFINIKVDREELPEVDGIYMQFAQAMLGNGGWPLNVILTPDLIPFFAATYIPKKTSDENIGIEELIKEIEKLWNSEEKEQLREKGNQIVKLFQDQENYVTLIQDLPKKDVLQKTQSFILSVADVINGGINAEPKFPLPSHITFLLRLADSRSLFYCNSTLTKMAKGGIYDQLGGGFARYTVDKQWLIPHFEKMLLDNIFLSPLYLEAWQLTKNPLYQKISLEILDYILSDLKAPEGGFYTAQDADSEKTEGLFYTWTYSEVVDLLGQDDGEVIALFYGIDDKGNFNGRSTLHKELDLTEFCEKHNLSLEETSKRITRINKLLIDKRNLRTKPMIDKKILTSLNGLLIHSFALAFAAFSNKKHLTTAKQIAEFIYQNLWKENILYTRWIDGEVKYQGGLEEHAFLISGLITLFEVDGEAKWLQWALDLTSILENDYKIDKHPFYCTDGKDENLILRRYDLVDGAKPSANAVHSENLLRLYKLTSNENHLNQALDILKATGDIIDNAPLSATYFLLSLQRYYNANQLHIIIILNANEDNKRALQSLIYSRFIPSKTVTWITPNDTNTLSLLPYLKNYQSFNQKSTVYICNKNICLEPLTDLESIREKLNQL